MRSYLVAGWSLIGAVTVLVFLIKYPSFEEKQDVVIKDAMTLRHLAERNDVPVQSLVPLLSPKERGDLVTTFRNIHRPLREHHLDRDDIRNSILTARAEGFPMRDLSRYILWALWIVAAGYFLMRRKPVRRLRRLWLIVTFTVFGIILGAAPNPMEATVRLHKLSAGIPGNPVVLVTLSFVIFTLMSLFGARMLCSWGCQLGALQESLYDIPVFRRFKTSHKFPFAASIAVRITMYLIFFLLLFGILNINQGGPGSILYHHFNLFKIFDPYELAPFTLLLVPLLLLTSLFLFRPFCHTICPFGLWAWLLENLAVHKVRKVDPAACEDCGVCEDACPTDAMKALNEGSRRYFRPDCWSCGNCIDACPQGALAFTGASWWTATRPEVPQLSGTSTRS